MKLNKIYHLLAILLLGVVSACSPKDYDLAPVDVKAGDLAEGIAFTITHDADNPNIIHLKSLMPANYSVAWEHPQGRSTDVACDLKIPFAGEYEVRFGVSTRGGYVWSDTYKFTVTDMCADFISDPLWTLLTGGGGKSKTWLIDVDEYGQVYSPFKGPKWFFTNGYDWDKLHNSKGGSFMDDDWDASTAIDPSYAGVWYWAADYPGNSWMCEAKNYGRYTFDLIGGANLTIEKDGEVMQGKFDMDADRHTFSMSGVEFEFFPGQKNYNILYLSEDFMMLLCANPAEPETWTSINFMSEEYRKNWQPTPEPKTLPEGWYDVLVNQNLYGSWAMDYEEPFDFFDLDGNRKNKTSEFTIAGDLTAISLKFNNPSLDLYAATDINGDQVDGEYSISKDGTIYLSKGSGKSEIASPDIYLSTAKDNTLKVLDVKFDDFGRISDLWVGRLLYDYALAPYQYLGYHLKAVLGGDDGPSYKVMFQLFDTGWAWFDAPALYIKGEGTYTMESAPGYVNPYGIFLDVYKMLGEYPNMDIILDDIKVNGSTIPFDDSQISRGYGDDPTTARRYILNPWGDTSMTPLFTTTTDGTVQVTFTIKLDTGVPFITE